MKTFTLPTRDGFVLSATEFMPAREARGTVVFAGATGVPQGYYRALAEHLRDSGFRAVTFDYRGLGRSKPQSLRGFKADYFDWAERDLAAVLDHAAGAGQVFLVCHSFGGHALGLLPNHEKVRAVFSFGVGAGNVRYMPFSEWPRVFVLWNLLGPLLTRAFGYLPSKHLGMGENLPLGVIGTGSTGAACRASGLTMHAMRLPSALPRCVPQSPRYRLRTTAGRRGFRSICSILFTPAACSNACTCAPATMGSSASPTWAFSGENTLVSGRCLRRG